MNYQLVTGDCVAVMDRYAPNLFDAMVTDPPYGLEFMGAEWDRLGAGQNARPGIGQRPTDWVDNRGWNERRCLNCGYLPSGASACTCANPLFGVDASRWRNMQAWYEAWARSAWRVMKPGAHLLTFGGTRTWHRLASAIEDAGWEIRDCLMWLYGSGFPKSQNGCRCKPPQPDGYDEYGWEICGVCGGAIGTGTALKPMWEPIILARKPLVGTVDQNMTMHGTGALNIDGCRVGDDGGSKSDKPYTGGAAKNAYGAGLNDQRSPQVPGLGRWPGNVALDDYAAARIELQTPGAARFFYTAKASQSERERGLHGVARRDVAEWPQSLDGNDARGASPRANYHPTVKPVDLMRWLVRMVTPPDGVVIDPFMGSGTTGVAAMYEGVRFLGIERNPEYGEIAKRRIAYAAEDEA